MIKPLEFWQLPTTQQRLTSAQKQEFIRHVALYKAIRNQDDAQLWFETVQPAFYNDILLDWQIRRALKAHQWNQVDALISHFQDKKNPCWQYWLARAKEKLGKKKEAEAIYQTLAKTRQYYGFLASMRLKKAFTFLDETPIKNKTILKPYEPITAIIKSLYKAHQIQQASRLLSDFISELPKEDKSALIDWVARDLQWYAKSVYLSQYCNVLTNQLVLRFFLFLILRSLHCMQETLSNST